MNKNNNNNSLVPLLSNSLVTIQTSSNYDGFHTGSNATLDYTNSQNTDRDGTEAWVPSISDNNQYIIAGGDGIKTFVSITLQGRGDQDQWVTQYKISYTLDGKSWINYRNGSGIQGCWDKTTPSVHYFDEPFRARSIMLQPTQWFGGIALRMEIYVQDLKEKQPIPSATSSVQYGKVQVPSNSILATQGHLPSKSLMVPVKFDTPFANGQVPKITPFFSNITTSFANTLNVKVVAKNISSRGFDLEFTTDEFTRAYGLVAEYIAVQSH